MSQGGFRHVDVSMSEVCIPEYDSENDDVRAVGLPCDEHDRSESFRITAVRPIVHRRFRRVIGVSEINARACQVYVEHREHAQWLVLKLSEHIEPLEKETQWLLRLAHRGVRVPSIKYLGWISREHKASILPQFDIMPAQPRFICLFMERFSFQLNDDLPQLGVPDPHLPYAIHEVETHFAECLESVGDARLLAEGFYVFYILESVLNTLIVLDNWADGISYQHADVRARNVVFNIDDKVDAALIDYEDIKLRNRPSGVANQYACDVLSTLLSDLFEAAKRQRASDSGMLPRWMRDVRYMDSVLEIVLFALDQKRGLRPEENPRETDVITL